MAKYIPHVGIDHRSHLTLTAVHQGPTNLSLCTTRAQSETMSELSVGWLKKSDGWLAGLSWLV